MNNYKDPYLPTSIQWKAWGLDWTQQGMFGGMIFFHNVISQLFEMGSHIFRQLWEEAGNRMIEWCMGIPEVFFCWAATGMSDMEPS